MEKACVFLLISELEVSIVMSNKKFSAFLAATSILALAVFSGGCGGGTSGVADNGNPDGPDSYSSQIAEKLVAKDNVHDMSEFVKDKSITVSKGDVLLYYPENGEDIRGYDGYLTRLDDALAQGAALAFVDVTAEEIDKLTNELELNLPTYLPDDATSKDKAEVEDFYAVLVEA